MRNLFLLIIVVMVSSCKPSTKLLTAQEIIDKSIMTSGVDKVANAKVEFEFRKRNYKAIRKQGKFSLERLAINEGVITHDKLSNNGFERYRNAEFVIVPDSMATRYAGAVNSVHYFSVLPYGLNDKAVQKKFLGETSIKNKKYYKIQITFSEIDGGEDFEDVFIYWIAKESFKLDYLAYSFHVNGGGMRFREATNERVVNGVRFVDYNNFKPMNALSKLENLDKAFENNQLKKISEILLENVQVTVLN